MLQHRKHRNGALLHKISLLVVMNQELQQLYHVINRSKHEAIWKTVDEKIYLI